MILKKPIMTEKIVKLLELENTIVFEVDKNKNKKEIKKYFEEFFKVNIQKIRTLTKENTKIAYIRLDKKDPAIDIATKLGMI